MAGGVFASLEEIAKLRADLHVATKTLKMTQMNDEVIARSLYSSGLQRTRQYHDASKSYVIDSISGLRAMGMHNHHNHNDTIGLGELAAILNGFVFRTRHNDFAMRMPHKKSQVYGAVEPIPYPPVPGAVLNKKNIKDQIAEMQLWFKAFKDQDHKERDYRKHFKSVLCYLEGAWTLTSDNKIDEPFASDRHAIDADTFRQLQQIVMFNEMTGHVNNGENCAILPTRIMGFVNKTTPVVAQWNFAIKCHPTKKLLPTNRLRPIDDFHLRVQEDLRSDQYYNSQKARFTLNAVDQDEWYKGDFTYGLLDELMGEVPGMDNYKAKIVDDAYNNEAMRMDKMVPTNAGFYHRWYRSKEKGAMGENNQHKGYNDPHLFMAMNTQEKIAPVFVENNCKVQKDGSRPCEYEGHQRWSYAVPLELIYLTPLGSWNPYNLQYRGSYKTEEGKMAEANGRNGGLDKSKAFDGMNSMTFYQTPAEFYTGTEQAASADTVKSSAVGVLMPNGDVAETYASGIQIMTREIPGVGKVRMRYPIFPLAEDGQTAYKELKALQEYIIKPTSQRKIMNESIYLQFEETSDVEQYSPGTFQMTSSSETGNNPSHTHTVTLTDYDLEVMNGWSKLTFTSSKVNDHQHVLLVSFNKKANSFQIAECDGQSTCADGHGKDLTKIVTPEEVV